MNARVLGLLCEVVDAWLRPDVEASSREELLLEIGSLAPDLVLDVTDWNLETEAWSPYLSDVLEVSSPPVAVVHVRTSGASGAAGKLVAERCAEQSLAAIALTATGKTAGTIISDRLCAEGLIPQEVGDVGAVLPAFYSWLGEAGERGAGEAECLERAYRLARQKLAILPRGRNEETRTALQQLVDDISARLAILNASRRLQAVDEHRRRLRYRDPGRLGGPVGHLGSLLQALDAGEHFVERLESGEPVISGSDVPPELEGLLGEVRDCVQRLGALADRLPLATPGRGSRQVGGRLLARIQEQLRGECDYLFEVRRQAELVAALGRRVAELVKCSLPPPVEAGLSSALSETVHRLLSLEADCGFGAAERALNALAGRSSPADAFPGLTADVSVAGSVVGGQLQVTAVGLVPRVDAFEQVFEVAPGVRAVRLAITLPTLFLGRLDFKPSPGIDVLAVRLVPQGGRELDLRVADLRQRGEGILTTGTFFAGG
ncbi:MAG: hypothetical protein AB1486_11545 [Planctomycetota bacterium]